MLSNHLSQAKISVFASLSRSILTLALTLLSITLSGLALAEIPAQNNISTNSTPLNTTTLEIADLSSLPVHIADDGHHYLTKFQYFVDTDNTLTIEKLLDPTTDTESTLVTNQQPNLGQIDHPVWFHFRVKNVEPTEQTLVLQVHFSLIDHLELYRVQTNQAFTKAVAGDTISANKHKRSSFLFEETIGAGETADFYLRAETQSSMWLPISISPQEAYKNYLQQSSIFNGIFYGIIIGLLCFNLFIYFSVREASYLYYIALMVTNLLFWLTIDGIAFE